MERRQEVVKHCVKALSFVLSDPYRKVLLTKAVLLCLFCSRVVCPWNGWLRRLCSTGSTRTRATCEFPQADRLMPAVRWCVQRRNAAVEMWWLSLLVSSTGLKSMGSRAKYLQYAVNRPSVGNLFWWCLFPTPQYDTGVPAAPFSCVQILVDVLLISKIHNFAITTFPLNKKLN